MQKKRGQKVIDTLIDVGYCFADNVSDKETASELKSQLKEIKKEYHSDYQEKERMTSSCDSSDYSDNELDDRIKSLRGEMMKIIARDNAITEMRDRMGFRESMKYHCSKEYEEDEKLLKTIRDEYDKLDDECNRLMNIRRQRLKKELEG